MSNHNGKPPQTKQTAKLAEKIRQARERGDIWTKICIDNNLYTPPTLLKPNGEPDTGLAYKIAFEGYEPSHRETRDRLGLRDICVKCYRAFRKKGTPRIVSEARLWWDGLNTKQKSDNIENMYQIEKRNNGR